MLAGAFGGNALEAPDRELYLYAGFGIVVGCVMMIASAYGLF